MAEICSLCGDDIVPLIKADTQMRDRSGVTDDDVTYHTLRALSSLSLRVESISLKFASS